MNEQNLARQAELTLDRQGGYDSLFYEGRTLCGLLASTVRRRGGEPAYSDRDDGGPWLTITWEQTRQQALELAAGLIGLGLQPADSGILPALVSPSGHHDPESISLPAVRG